MPLAYFDLSANVFIVAFDFSNKFTLSPANSANLTSKERGFDYASMNLTAGCSRLRRVYYRRVPQPGCTALQLVTHLEIEIV